MGSLSFHRRTPISLEVGLSGNLAGPRHIVRIHIGRHRRQFSLSYTPFRFFVEDLVVLLLEKPKHYLAPTTNEKEAILMRVVVHRVRDEIRKATSHKTAMKIIQRGGGTYRLHPRINVFAETSFFDFPNSAISQAARDAIKRHTACFVTDL